MTAPAFAICRRRQTDTEAQWIGRGSWTLHITEAFTYGVQRKAEEIALELAWDNRGVPYEVWDAVANERVALISFSK